MRRLSVFGVVTLVVLAAVALTTWTFAEARAHDYSMVGIVVSGENVALEVDDQVGARDSITVARVVAPDDSWIVVHRDEDGMPGPRIGLLRVEAGESVDLEVPLDEAPATPDVIVALHADRGQRGVFEFAMDDFMSSPDKPYFVDLEEVARVVAVAEFGVVAAKGEAELEVGQGALDGERLTLSRVVAPDDSWVVVHLDEDGMPGMRVGIERVESGESGDITVSLEGDGVAADSLIVALHADRGVVGEFEFDMEDKVGSPDQPYFIDGAEVAIVVERQ